MLNNYINHSTSSKLLKSLVLCDSSRYSDSSPFYSDSDSSPVFFTLTRTRTWTQKSWLGPESRPSPSNSGRAVLRCLLWHSIHFVVCFHVLEDKQMLNMWTTRFVTRTRFFFYTRTRGLGLGLGGDDSDSDSDSEEMTRTRTRIWQPGLGHSTDNSCFRLIDRNTNLAKHVQPLIGTFGRVLSLGCT